MEEVLGAAGLVAQDDDEIETLIRFDDVDAAVRAFHPRGTDSDGHLALG